MSKFIDFLRDVFLPGETYNLDYKTGISEQITALAVTQFAARMAENMIAALISKCEFQTYLNDEAVKSSEWYLWNFAPNPNESGPALKTKLVQKLASGRDALVIEQGSELYVAESFTVSNRVMYPAKFTDVTLLAPDGSQYTLDRTFTADDVLYFRSGNADVPALLQNVELAYENLMQLATGKYKRAGGRRGVARIKKTPSGDEEKRKEYQAAVDKIFRKYFTEENGLAVLNEGIDFAETPNQAQTGSQNEVNNLVTLTKEAFYRAAQAYRIPPILLLGEVADLSSAMQMALTVCIDPLVNVIETEINRKRYGLGSILAGSRLRIDTTHIEHVDIFSIAGKADKLIADGVCSIDEIRALIGLLPLNTWWSEKHWMTKNYDGIEAAGEEGNNE